MNTGNPFRRIVCLATTLAFCAAAFLMLSGCARSSGDSPTEFTVISDGTVSTTVSSASAASDEPEETDEYASLSSTKLIIPEYMETKYASLDYDTRKSDVYNDVVNAMQSFDDHMYMPLTISGEEFAAILETVRCEQLWLISVSERKLGDFVADKHTFEMDFTYKYSIKETNIMLRKVEEAGDEIFKSIDESMTDYEKLMIFHDWLVLNCETSTTAPYADTLYGALVSGEALCEGFAKAFSYLCNRAGIENIIVTGYTDVDHMWNMVKMDDGNWYHVDCTWDKPDEALAELYPDMVLYQYFLSDDDVIRNNRTISTKFCQPPVADSSAYSYFIAEDCYAYSYDEALEIIEDGCRRCIDSGEKYFMLKLDSSNLYLQTTEWLKSQDENGQSDIDRIVERINFVGQISYIDYYKAHRVIIFVLEQSR